MNYIRKSMLITKITTLAGKIIVECKDGTTQVFPKETLESIMLFGNISMTVPVQKKSI